MCVSVHPSVRPSRCSVVLVVQCVSGGIWEFPITLIATEPQVDDVILTEATELGKTSAVGFRLTSTTRCVYVWLYSDYCCVSFTLYISNMKCTQICFFDRKVPGTKLGAKSPFCTFLFVVLPHLKYR